MRKNILILVVSAAALPCFAQGTNQQYNIEYGSNSWNVDSTKLDNAYMFVRDPGSNKIARVLVEETAPDSNVFSGKFSIDWAAKSASQLQVYVPPQNVRADEKSLQKFNTQIQNGRVESQPVLVRKGDKSTIIDVYDTRDQLTRAKEIYEREQAAKAEAEKVKNSKPAADENALKAAQMAERAKIMAEIASNAAKRETERLRLEQLEQQRREEQLKKAAQMAAAEKARRKAQAQAMADKGSAAYQASDFKAAEDFFHQAKEIDPTNESFYFMYGVALYRNDKFNEALVFLRLAKTTGPTELERKYYMGLIHYRLQELEPAIQNFKAVKASGDEVLAPSAAFYEGLCLMTLDKLEDAQKSFEWVVDNSKDPGLDEKAEEYIEKIANMIRYKKQMEKKWSLDAQAGINYDSNILYVPDNGASSQGTASDEGGLRTLASGSLQRRLSYSDTSDWAAKLSSYYMYSFDSQFNRADPWLSSFGVVHGRRGMTPTQTGYQMSINPYYEILYLDDDDDGTRDNILNSIVLDSSVTLIKREDYFAAYGVVIRRDDATPSEATTDDDNADALQYELNTSHTLFLDKTKKRALIGNAAYLMNDAEGKNEQYNKFSIGVTYAAPAKKWKETIWTLGLSAYRLSYLDDDEDRKDTNMELNYTLTKTMSEQLSYTGTATYSSNTSSVDDNQYSKISVMGLVNYSWAQ